MAWVTTRVSHDKLPSTVNNCNHLQTDRDSMYSVVPHCRHGTFCVVTCLTTKTNHIKPRQTINNYKNLQPDSVSIYLTCYILCSYMFDDQEKPQQTTSNNHRLSITTTTYNQIQLVYIQQSHTLGMIYVLYCEITDNQGKPQQTITNYYHLQQTTTKLIQFLRS